MAKYKVLASTAHNYGASFISVMNIAHDDYAMCYLLRAVEAGADPGVEVDLLSGRVSPRGQLPPKLLQSIAGYVAHFGRHVQNSGAALDMITTATLRVRVVRGHLLGPAAEHDELLRARVHCEVEFTDDRGKLHIGRAQEEWVCHPSQRFW